MGAKAMPLEACTWDAHIDVDAAGRRARLAPSFLLHHEMGVEARLVDEITPPHWARVHFDLPAGRPAGALVLWYVGWVKRRDRRPMHLVVNGHRLRHELDWAQLLTGGWDRHPIPGRFLRPGRNEIVFRDVGRLYVDPGPTHASARSFDAGRTWHADALGPTRDQSGDYMVRLRVKGYAPQGRLTSPVLDLADLDDEGRIAPARTARRVRLAVQARRPPGTKIVFEMRTGSSPMVDPACWTPWQTGTRLTRPARFLQWRATLTTARLEATPTLTAVTVHADPPPPAAAADLRVTRWDRPVLRRSSYPFICLAPHPRAERLVKQYRLNEVVAPGRTDLEKLSRLREWVHRQWYGWQSDRYPYCPPWDPLEILETVKGNWGYGMCTHYAATFVGCAAALGFVARVLIIDHHCLAEVWIDDLGRWICMDPGPHRAFHAVYEMHGRPLNALEIHRALAEGRSDSLQERRFPGGRLYPMRRRVARLFCRFGIPLRNNHLVQPEPAEQAHGQNQYHWNGYLWWTDQADPQYPEYSLQTRREADLYWTVGRVRLYLEAAAPDRLRVQAEHAMPTFDHYQVRRDLGPWQRTDLPLDWPLAPGENHLEIKAVNAFGREGPPTAVAVHRPAAIGPR